jgi:hypothetical protein
MKPLFSFLLLVLATHLLQAQNNTSEYVYFILQQRCASCHSGSSPAGSLDLQGQGATQVAQMQDVYNNLVNQTPSNAHAAGQGYDLIKPGQFYDSYLFRKLNAGFQPNLKLDQQEGDDHSDPNLYTITDTEKEVIRQWILFDAPLTGDVVNVPILQKYYAGDSVPSFSTPPPAPDPAEGFQIHMGPFFLEPYGEDEFYWKYPTQLSQDVEVHKIEGLFGLYSHHMILYKYEPNTSHNRGAGIRRDNAHSYVKLVTAQQYPDTMQLPEGSAFFWDAGTVLDVNSHYINYSGTDIAKCEVYLNVYTQPKGTASQEMFSEILANPSIWIPNDGQTHTFEADFFDSRYPINLYLWSISSHTHQYGTDFNIYLRDEFGNKDDLIFDAEYANGDHNDFFIGYDYQHPPFRYFDEFLPVRLDKGITYQASYRNTGPRSVGWGDTSDDEMMVITFAYLLDTTGVRTTTTSLEPLYPEVKAGFAPHPISDRSMLQLQGLALDRVELQLHDALGRLQHQSKHPISPNQFNQIPFDRGNLPAGLYLYRLQDPQGNLIWTGKALIR